jgi:hypothetical protein
MSPRITALYAGLTIFASAAVVALLGADWYGVEAFAGNDLLGNESGTGWQVSSSVDALICIFATVAALSAYGAVVFAWTRASLASVLAAIAVFGLVLYRVIEPPDLPEAEGFHAEFDRLAGLWAALFVAALAVGGAVAATVSRRGGQAPQP